MSLQKLQITALFTLSLLLSNIAIATAQKDSTTINPPKNVIHLSLGTLVLLNSAQITYDRKIAESEKGFFKAYYLTFKGGVHGTLDFSGGNNGSGFIMSAGATALTGKRKNHFEVGLRLGYFIEQGSADGNNARNIFPSFSVGYRKQTDNGFVFRTGLGVAEWVYVGFGYSF